MELRTTVLLFVIGTALFSAGIISGYYFGSSDFLHDKPDATTGAIITDSIADALDADEVIVRVHGADGNLKSEQKTHNIITSGGAIWFCVQQNRCESHISNESPNVASVTNPTGGSSLSAEHQTQTNLQPQTAPPRQAEVTLPGRSQPAGALLTLRPLLLNIRPADL